MENLFYRSILHVPSTVQIQETSRTFQFSGPLGTLEYEKSQIDSLGLAFTSVQENTFQIFVKKTSRNSKSFFGSLQTFYTKIFHGVSQGFLVSLELVGVGFRAFPYGNSQQNLSHSLSETSPKNSHQSSLGSQVPGVIHFHHSRHISSLIELKIGQSHPLVCSVPDHLRVFFVKPTLLSFYGLDHQALTQFTAQLRHLRLPDPYKGKGIRLKGQIIPLKIGKKKS